MISLQDICVSFGSFDLLTNISFLINDQDRIGLAGKNGSGKSTLLRIIAGLQLPSSGMVDMPKDITIGYLPQQMRIKDSTTIINEVVSGFREITELSEEIERCRKEITEREDYESEDYLRLCDHLALIEERYSILGGNNYLAEAERTLLGLGFKRSDFERLTSELSGGWRMRIELAKILLKKPSVFLLDEPTNHLDIESIQWLEDYLASYNGALVLVSHDRAFLDNITTRTIEISLGKIYDYKVSWSEFVILRKERREQQTAAFRNQQKMIGDTEKFIERFRYKATKAVQVQSKIKMLNRVERIEIDEEDISSINLKFPPAPRSGTTVIETEGLSKTYGSLQVLKDVDFKLIRGEKVAFVGRNGEGKTTFVKIIAGELDHEGHITKGHNVRIGYFAQNQDELLNEDLTVFDTIDYIAKGEVRSRIRDMLASFLFKGDDIDKKVKVLSGGERSRLALIKLLLEPYNLLLLDEPTNHLDIRSKDILKQALLKYDGTLIVVSHDRDFLDGITSKVFEFRNNSLKEHLGGIYDFLRKKDMSNLREIERKDKTIKNTNPDNKENISSNKQKYLEKKNYERNLRKLRKRVENSELEIERMEKEMLEMNRILSTEGNTERNTDLIYERYRKLEQRHYEEMLKWEQYTQDVEVYLQNKI
ncbi:MAG TPA: ATP-binding cassette domain-containing protein [Bacteroidales bacterium]|nr:ATP-binding cassette domain-containing protein [Bacteroidales bacterium]HPI67579.1 ATP-binding cassette domain-containing protein [Bacteroidales bacterium]HPR73519.1 ATP-binding cassette domain-containing protein [Bacteroidales bacterium]